MSAMLHVTFSLITAAPAPNSPPPTPTRPSALAFLPEGHLTPGQRSAFKEIVANVRGRTLCWPEKERHGGLHRAADRPMGGILVLPVSQRRVPIAVGFRRHLNRAATLGFPLDSRLRASALSSDAQCAVRTTLIFGDEVEARRDALIAANKADADRCRHISSTINTLMPTTVSRIAAQVNTCWMAALVDGLGIRDTSIVECFVYGFSIVGDVPDSGQWRSIEPRGTALEHSLSYSFFRTTAPMANRRLIERLSGHKWAGELQLEADTAVARKTYKEQSKGVVVGPYLTPEALHSAMCRLHPHLDPRQVYPRIMERFGVRQKGDIRAIDNGRSNGANAATRLYETITTPHFSFTAVAARATAVAAGSLGIPIPHMTVSLCDLAMAYRTIPTSQPWYTAVAFYNPIPTPPRPEIYWLPGHNFGLASAVVNFGRYPELVTISVRCQYAVDAEHYYDDIIIPDVVAAGESGLRVVREAILMLGPGVQRPTWRRIQAPELDPDKDKPAAAVNVVLGVVTNMTNVASSPGFVAYSVNASRKDSILAIFRTAFERGVLSPHEAASLRGKIMFTLSAAYGAIGRAATLPLLQRQYRDVSHSFLAGSELHHSYMFFSELFPILPRLEIPIVPDPTPPLLVYTDASFWRSRKRARRALEAGASECGAARAELRGALGAVVYDPIDESVRYAAADPPWDLLLSSWRTDRKTYIAELEALAAVAVYTTFPTLFLGRKVNHFIDNTVALSALVHGYAGKPDLAKITNVFYMQALGLRASVYFDYVASKANIADLPSRREFDKLKAELAGLDVRSTPSAALAVPDVSSWEQPLRSWSDRFAHLDRPAHLPV